MLSARDINLDAIYINNSQGLLSRLMSLKHNAYQILRSTPVDDNVIFSGWVSGNRLVYVKEYRASGNNEVFEYYPASRKRNKIASVKGAIIFAKSSLNGHYLYLKLIHENKSSLSGEIVIVNLRDIKIVRKTSNSALLDFTVAYYGDSIFYESSLGIMEFYPDDSSERLVVPLERYRQLMSRNNITLAYVSPLRNRILLVNGGGGSYTGLLLDGLSQKIVEGVSSASEISWLDNKRIVFRSGTLARYTVVEYDSDLQKPSQKSAPSLNTNIAFSPFDCYVAYNLDGIISFYFSRYDDTKSFSIEGEDVFFSPDGHQFLSLFQKRLYLSRYSALQESQIELKRNSAEILSLYRRIGNSEGNLLNDYSDEYIKRKILIYEMVTR